VVFAKSLKRNTSGGAMEPMWAIAAMGIGIAWAVATRKMFVAWLERRRDAGSLDSAIRLAELQVSVALVQEQLAAMNSELRALRAESAAQGTGAGVAVGRAPDADGARALGRGTVGNAFPDRGASPALPPRQTD
jgi:hypothetical protein